MDIVGGILADDEREIPSNNGEDEAASLLYGDESVIIRMESPDVPEKIIHYFILKAPTQQFLSDSYQNNSWNTKYEIKRNIREKFQRDSGCEIIAFIVINGTRHFHGYIMIEDDSSDFQQLNEEEQKLKPLKVRWMKLCHLPFHQTTNILNNGQPVKSSHNGNEITSDCGSQLLELIDQGPEETIESQKEKIQAYDSFLTSLFSEQFELPDEDAPAIAEQLENKGVEEKETTDENKASTENNKAINGKSGGSSSASDSSKRRGRSRSGDRGDGRRNKTGGSYLDLFDIVNMTYEEYLEAYRNLQMRAYDEYVMSMQPPPPPMEMGPPPGMMPHHMSPPGHFPPPDGFYGHHPHHHPNMGPPHMGMGMGMMGGPPHHGHMGGGGGGGGGGRGGGYRGGRGF